MHFASVSRQHGEKRMKLDTDNWQLLQDLFHLAEVTPEADREHVLAEKCPDEVIRRRAMKIFDSSRIDGSQETPTPPSALAPDLNGKIGPYTLIRHLGTGGIGAVYLVERMVGGALQRDLAADAITHDGECK